MLFQSPVYHFEEAIGQGQPPGVHPPLVFQLMKGQILQTKKFSLTLTTPQEGTLQQRLSAIWTSTLRKVWEVATEYVGIASSPTRVGFLSQLCYGVVDSSELRYRPSSPVLWCGKVYPITRSWKEGKENKVWLTKANSFFSSITLQTGKVSKRVYPLHPRKSKAKAFFPIQCA